MKTRKKIVSILLTFMLLIGLMPTALAAESSYQDTNGHWAEAAIERWSGYGVIQGNNGSFNPNGSLTRAHMAAVLSRLLNLPEAPDAGFTDVKEGDWHAEYINKCAAAGIMLGSDGKANPNAPITRQQAIVMLGRALGIQPVENPDLSNFQDGTAISDYAKGYVAAMNEAGIVGGITSDTLGGGSDITRAQTVTILNRAIGTYANEAGTTVEASSSGITLVAADNVTVTGTADSVLVSQGAQDGTVTLSSGSAGSVTVTAENATVYVTSESKADDVTLTETAVDSKVVVLKGAEVGTVTTAAPGSTVSVSGKVETIATTATAEKASVEVAKNATVGEIAASGEKTAIAVSGKVENVTVSDTATDTTVKANSGSTISKVDNAAEGTTVSGSGKVENVTTSGDNTTVSTPGTKVEADKGTTGTTAGNKDVAGGSSTTTGGSTSGGSSSGGSSHSHSYTSSVTTAATCTTAGVRTYTCSCGASYTEAIPATGVHTYTYADNSDGTHTGTCSVCGAKVETEKHTAGDTAACTKCGAAIVAKVGTTGYTTLAEALSVGGEVILVDDISGQTVIPADKTVTLDLNGHTITHTRTTIINNGTLTIKDTAGNGTVKSTNHASVAVGHNSVTTIESGNFVAVEGGVITGYATGATININGGVYTVSDNAVIAGNGNRTDADAAGKPERVNPNTINITGGTFNGGITTSGYVACGIYAPWKDTITVSGGTFNITGGAGIVARAGNVNVTGGTFNVTGKVTGKVGDSRGVVPCSAIVFDSEANYYAMTDDSKITVSGGTFDSEVDNIAIVPSTDTKRVEVTGGTFKVGSTKEMNTILDAISASASDVTVELEDSVTLSDTINVSKNVTIDGGDNTLDAYYKDAFKVTGLVDFTLRNITIYTGKNGVEAITANGSKLTFEKVNISNAFKAIHFNSCTNTSVSINGCNLTSVYPFNVNGGSMAAFSVKDSALNGWTSYGGTCENYTFVDCSFGEGSGYATLKPYHNTTLTGCTFSQEYFENLEGGIASGTNVPITVNFNNCFVKTSDGNTEALTVELLKTAFNYDITSGSSSGESTIENQYWYINGEKIGFTSV